MDRTPTVDDAMALLTDRQYIVARTTTPLLEVGTAVLRVLQGNGASEAEARTLVVQAADRLCGHVEVTQHPSGHHIRDEFHIYVPRDRFPPADH
jgi:hypothetical protein